MSAEDFHEARIHVDEVVAGDGGRRGPGRRAWRPEADDETAALLRRLANTPWLVSGRDDEQIAGVRRNEKALRAAVARLGWVLVIERDLVRLRKSPPPRPAQWAADGPAPLVCSWFFLLVAAAESMRPRVALGQLVNGARVAAAEANLPPTGDLPERRAIARAVHLLDERGVIETLDGDVDGYVKDEDAPVLLAIHHTRVAHIVANPGTIDPAADPSGWLEQVQREPEAARRMRRALIDDTCVHTAFLDEGEAQWLSQRVRGDDGAPLAAAFGLALERRTEGAAFVVPEDKFRHPRELGPFPFPIKGTVAQATLMLCAHAAIHGTTHDSPGLGWRGLTSEQVRTALARFAAERPVGKGGWSGELADDPDLLAERVAGQLAGINLLRTVPSLNESSTSEEGNVPTIQQFDTDALDLDGIWWFAPATGRWAEEEAAPTSASKPRSAQRTPGKTMDAPVQQPHEGNQKLSGGEQLF